MDAKDVSSSTDDDIIEMQLKKAQGEAAALRDDKERLSQVRRNSCRSHIVINLIFFKFSNAMNSPKHCHN
jgi:predicted NAD-dependent protein-ADP-ribosyltransferase YbiA (DUF1768 family)